MMHPQMWQRDRVVDGDCSAAQETQRKSAQTIAQIGGKVRHLGRWRSVLGRDPFAIPGEHHPVSLR